MKNIKLIFTLESKKNQIHWANLRMKMDCVNNGEAINDSNQKSFYPDCTLPGLYQIVGGGGYITAYKTLKYKVS